MSDDLVPGVRLVARRCPACGRQLDVVGLVHVEDLRDKATVLGCSRCDVILAVYTGVVLWTLPLPSADPDAVRAISGRSPTIPRGEE